MTPKPSGSELGTIFGNTDTWLTWNLTGGTDGGLHVTDVTNASRTMLMNLETLDWDEELMGFFGIPRSMLPTIVPSSDPEGFGVIRVKGPLGGLADPVDVLEDPLDLPAGEVRRRREAGLLPDDVALALPLERGRDPVGAGVLPDDGVVVGPAGPPVPHHRGLALVGDAAGREVGRRQALLAHGGAHDRDGALPDLHRVVLDPARLREDLLVLELVLALLVACVVEDHEAGAGRSLVDSSDEVSHSSCSSARLVATAR